MTEAIYTALLLLLVGMVTVFVILTGVVLCGRLVIWFSNKFVSEELDKADDNRLSIEQTSHKKKIAAIAAAVDVVSQGQGRIARINKLDAIRNHG